jgi:MFS family permease
VSAAKDPSAWAPLKRPLFRDRWIASLVSNTGGWMQDTAATWLMTALTTRPLLIALMQTAATLPVLLLGLPAGALADILDRRRLLLFWQAWMLVAAVVLSIATFSGGIGPWSLVALTLALNAGAAMNNPAWQAIVPELVPRAEVSHAIALNSAAFNLARAVGPAAGGLMMAAFVSSKKGGGAVFFLNAVSFLFVIVVLYRWKRTPFPASELPGERFLGGVRAGLRYVGHAHAIRGILIRAILVTSCVSAMWALLAVVAQSDLRHGALGYGLLNACIGIGAVAGALVLPRVRARFSPDRIVRDSTIAFALALMVMAFVHHTAVVVVALLLAGFAWISTTATFNIAIQEAVPAWVQARALGTYQMVFQGGLAVGSAAWGFFAEKASTPTALCLASLGLVAGLPLARRFRIESGASLDLSPAMASGLTRSAPVVIVEPRPEQGPVLVSIEYRIEPDDAPEFRATMHGLKTIRLRDGAMRWGLFADPVDPVRYVETFLVESWAEYLRQRERMTMNDLTVRDKAYSFQRGEIPPPISRMIYTPTAPQRDPSPQSGSLVRPRDIS